MNAQYLIQRIRETGLGDDKAAIKGVMENVPLLGCLFGLRRFDPDDAASVAEYAEARQIAEDAYYLFGNRGYGAEDVDSVTATSSCMPPMMKPNVFDAIDAKMTLVFKAIFIIMVPTIVCRLIWPESVFFALLLLGIICVNVLIMFYNVLEMWLTS